VSTGIVIPRLSESLRTLSWPHRCQCCQCVNGSPLSVWQEHDDADRPELIFVVVCATCADKIIEPHPRLYRQLGRNEPAPGVLGVCQHCRHQVAGRCRSPKARANGGEGLRFPAPDVNVHLCRRGKGARSGWLREWSEEVSSCEGFEEREGGPCPL
jgi:hypothetical protein